MCDGRSFTLISAKKILRKRSINNHYTFRALKFRIFLYVTFIVYICTYREIPIGRLETYTKVHNYYCNLSLSLSLLQVQSRRVSNVYKYLRRNIVSTRVDVRSIWHPRSLSCMSLRSFGLVPRMCA